MAALYCIDLNLDQKMSETRLKIKNIGVGFIPIFVAKIHRPAIKDFWKP
jgi:hypothetical protein